MTKAIWKYQIPLYDDIFIVVMPKGAKPLSAQVQKSNGFPFMWVEVDPNEETTNHVFLIVGTGSIRYDLDKAEFIDTLQLREGTLVSHLYYKGVQGGA